jgi:hypothetical protein
MKMNVKMMAAAMAVLGAVSCSKSDMYDPVQVEENKKVQEEAKIEQAKSDYEANFVEKYGEVDPNQSWDFSTGTPTISLPSSSAKAGTRAGGYERKNSDEVYSDDKDVYYEFPAATINKMKEVFVEGRDNRNLGTAFAMHAPANAIYIMPMYMGQSAGNFELWMHVEGIAEDIKVWSKWQDLEVKPKADSDWKNVKDHNSGSNCVGVAAIRSKYYKFSGLPENAVMHFYLKITETASGYNEKNQILTSISGYMRDFKFGNDGFPTGLKGIDENITKPEAMIIGVEDATTSKSDHDYNDVVFMIYGEPYVPQTFKVEEFETTYSKRYMIEDLGSTDDFDFNDIVVDVQETFTQKKTTDEQGLETWSDPVLKGQKAILRHRGGILPFELTIGNTKLEKMDGVLSDDPNTEFNNVTGWNRNSNNISIKVYQSADSQTANQVNFPQTGAIPMIIATDTNVAWSAERVAFNWKEFMPTPAE